MKFIYLLFLIAIAAFLSVVPSVMSADGTLIGFTYSGKVFAIDEVTGQGTFINSLGWSVVSLNSAASDSRGVIYTAPKHPTSGPTIQELKKVIQVDPVTGDSTFRVNIGFADVRGMSFSPDGKLYAIFDGGRDPASHEFLTDRLYIINLSSNCSRTSCYTLVGSTGANGLQSLAFSPDGRLFSWDVNRGLAVLNTSTGAATFIDVDDSIHFPDIQGLVFTPRGKLFGCRDTLSTIDLATGVASEIGGKGYSDIRGLVFLEGELALPEKSFLELILSRFYLIVFLFIAVFVFVNKLKLFRKN